MNNNVQKETSNELIEENIINYSNAKSNVRKVAGFFGHGFKKALSPNVDENIKIAKRIKERSLDLVIDFKDFFSIIGTLVITLFYYIIWLFGTAKQLPKAMKRGAQNNFRLGIEEMKKNNIIEARIRFLLSNMFFNKSSTTKYYIAYTYFLQDKYTKSLKYLKKSIDLNPSNERAIELVKIIETRITKTKEDNTKQKEKNN